jgi:hypothetical protein
VINGHDSDDGSSSGLSDVPMSMVGNKRHRSPSSSLSDEDEEDKPLAARSAPSVDSSFGYKGAMSTQDSNSVVPDGEIDPEIDAEADGDADGDMDADEDPSEQTIKSPTSTKRAGKTSATLGHVSLSNHKTNIGQVSEAQVAAEATAKENLIRTMARADEGQQVARLATGVTIDAGAAPAEVRALCCWVLSRNSIESSLAECQKRASSSVGRTCWYHKVRSC